jgi:hypothetical protein
MNFKNYNSRTVAEKSDQLNRYSDTKRKEFNTKVG